jgi:hypothetical protein
VQSIAASIQSVFRKTLQEVKRDFWAQSPAPKFCKNYMAEKIALRVIGSLDIMPRELRRRCHD